MTAPPKEALIADLKNGAKIKVSLYDHSQDTIIHPDSKTEENLLALGLNILQKTALFVEMAALVRADLPQPQD